MPPCPRDGPPVLPVRGQAPDITWPRSKCSCSRMRKGKGEAPDAGRAPDSPRTLVRTEAPRPPSCPPLPGLRRPVRPPPAAGHAGRVQTCVFLSPNQVTGRAGGGVLLGGRSQGAWLGDGPREPGSGTVPREPDSGMLPGSPAEGRSQGAWHGDDQQHIAGCLSPHHSDVSASCLLSLFHAFPILDSPVTGAHECPSVPAAHRHGVAPTLLTRAMPSHVSGHTAAVLSPGGILRGHTGSPGVVAAHPLPPASFPEVLIRGAPARTRPQSSLPLL